MRGVVPGPMLGRRCWAHYHCLKCDTQFASVLMGQRALPEIHCLNCSLPPRTRPDIVVESR